MEEEQGEDEEEEEEEEEEVVDEGEAGEVTQRGNTEPMEGDPRTRDNFPPYRLTDINLPMVYSELIFPSLLLFLSSWLFRGRTNVHYLRCTTPKCKHHSWKNGPSNMLCSMHRTTEERKQEASTLPEKN